MYNIGVSTHHPQKHHPSFVPLFLSLNISDFNLFFMWKLQLPPEKITPSFPATSSKSLKVEVLSSPLPFLKIWVEVHLPPPQPKGGVHYAICDGESPVILLAPAFLFYTLQRLTVSAHRCFEKEKSLIKLKLEVVDMWIYQDFALPLKIFYCATCHWFFKILFLPRQSYLRRRCTTQWKSKR